MEATVPYEESGWYDGQVWIKPPEFFYKIDLLVLMRFTLASSSPNYLAFLCFLFLVGCNFNMNT